MPGLVCSEMYKREEKGLRFSLYITMRSCVITLSKPFWSSSVILEDILFAGMLLRLEKVRHVLDVFPDKAMRVGRGGSKLEHTLLTV